MQFTFVMVKPDGVERGLVGKIISKFEKKGFIIKEIKMMKPSLSLLEDHYAEHKGKGFYDGLIKYMARDRVVAMMIGGTDQTVGMVRQMIGATSCHIAAPGTIRGDWSCQEHENLVHASDSPESAQRELTLWFSQ